MPSGTAVVLAMGEIGMLVWGHGMDPWLLLPPVSRYVSRVSLDVRLAGYSLVPGVTSLPICFQCRGSRY